MESIKEIFKIGYGPSSSHTMGPARAAIKFLNKNINASRFSVDLYGSLALTGKGHLTDITLKNILGEFRTEINFCNDITYNYHPNGMKFYAYNENNKLIDSWLVFSVGGGDLKELDENRDTFKKEVYPHKTMKDILTYIDYNNMSLVDYIKAFDESDLFNHLEKVFNTMKDTLDKGLDSTNPLPGRMQVKRKAKGTYDNYLKNNNKESLAFALALAMAEENANGGIVVTAPTCGSCGVVPAVIFTEYYYNHVSKEKLIEALAIAGLICNIVKTNGSISGAEVGCQGEVGVACAAATAALTYIYGGDAHFIEYSAEIALEHHLGMTCDPIDGLVQIPCIERNALATTFAFSASNYALLNSSKHYVDLDDVIKVMMETGKDINQKYRETSTGGLAKSKKYNETICN